MPSAAPESESPFPFLARRAPSINSSPLPVHSSSLDLSLAAFSALSPTAAASGAGTLDVIWGFNADAEDAEQPFEERGATTVLTSWVGEATGAGGW